MDVTGQLHTSDTQTYSYIKFGKQRLLQVILKQEEDIQWSELSSILFNINMENTTRNWIKHELK